MSSSVSVDGEKVGSNGVSAMAGHNEERLSV